MKISERGKKSSLYKAEERCDVKEIMKKSAEKFGEKNAFILKKKIDGTIHFVDISYKKFYNDLQALGTAISSLGYGASRIAVIGKNSYPWLLSYFMPICGTSIAVPLDKELPHLETENSLLRSEAEVLFFAKEQEAMLYEILQDKKTKLRLCVCTTDGWQPSEGISRAAATGNVKLASFEEILSLGREAIAAGDRSYIDAVRNPDEMAIILFTSGTTSSAKAVMLSSRNLASNVYGLNKMIDFREDDVNMILLPLHHTFGSTSVLLMLDNGATNVFCDGLKYIVTNLAEYKVSVLICVPLLVESMYKKIMTQVEKQGKTRLIALATVLSETLLRFGIDIRRKVFKEILSKLGGHLRIIISGAAALDKTVSAGFNSFGIMTLQGYGLTETSPVLAAENKEAMRPGSIGFPLCNVEVEIASPNESGIGELKAKGPNVMLGYYGNPEETAKILKDGWFYTGDLGYRDKDGFIFLCGRQKNVIVLKNGKNIYPEEIEVMLNKLPTVKESMVFGIAKGDDLVVSAEIVYNDEYLREIYGPLHADEIKKLLDAEVEAINTGLPIYKRIKRIFISQNEMIKTTTAKVKRYEEVGRILKTASESL